MNALDPIYCPMCKHSINPKDGFCGSCGAPQAPPSHRPPPRPVLQPSADSTLQYAVQTLPCTTPFLFNPGEASRLTNPNVSPLIRSQDIIGVVFAALFFAVGLMFAWGFGSQWFDIQLLERGSEIQGRVLSVEETGDTTDDGVQRVFTDIRYSYVVNDRTYSQKTYLDGGKPDSLKAGSPITVRYAPSRPSLSMLPEQFERKRKEASWIPTFFGMGIMVLMALLLRGVFDQRTLRRYREQQCRILPGRLVSFTGKEDSDGDFMVKAEYDFMSPHGNRCAGKRSECHNQLKKQPLPPPGTPVWIFYVAENDHEML